MPPYGVKQHVLGPMQAVSVHWLTRRLREDGLQEALSSFADLHNLEAPKYADLTLCTRVWTHGDFRGVYREYVARKY